MARRDYPGAAELFQQSVAEKALAVGAEDVALTGEMVALARALWHAGDVPAARGAVDRLAEITGARGGQWHLYHGETEAARTLLRAEAEAGAHPAQWQDWAESLGAGEAAEAWQQAALNWQKHVAPEHPLVTACSDKLGAGAPE